MELLIGGDLDTCDFFKLFFKKNNFNSIIYNELSEYNEKELDIKAAIIFAKTDIHTAEDIIKEIIKKYQRAFPILVVLENNRYHAVDNFNKIGVNDICFNFNPQDVFKDLKKLLSKKDESPVDPQHYVINFFENKNIFIIDLSGFLQKGKIIGLKLMFENFLKNKIHRLKGVIYILSNVNEEFINFDTIWALLKIWKHLGIDYKKITYLCNSEKISVVINKFFGPYGVKHFPNLLEIVRYFFPEYKGQNEMKLFEISSQLLQSDMKTKSPG